MQVQNMNAGRVGLITFADTPRSEVAMTSDRRRVLDRLRAMRFRGGSTLLADAALLVVNRLASSR